MAHKIILIFVWVGLSAFGYHKLGTEIPNLCWDDPLGERVCLHDNPGHLKVLFFGVGFEYTTESSIQGLIQLYHQFSGEPITYLALLVEGEYLTLPDATYLKQWRQEQKVPFPVVASSKVEALDFLPINDPSHDDLGPSHYGSYYPGWVVIDKSGKIVYKARRPMKSVAEELLTNLLGKSEPTQLLKIGDPVGSFCWKDHVEQTICSDTFMDQVQIWLYGAGYCLPCNMEMNQMVPFTKPYDQKPVRFISLSTAGWKSTAPADTTFLNEWKQKFDIPFPVVSADPDEISRFLTNAAGAVPTTVVIDKRGVIRHKDWGIISDVHVITDYLGELIDYLSG